MSIMNFQQTFRDVKPPAKGRFPLDHEGGPQFVKLYLSIIYGRRYASGFSTNFFLFGGNDSGRIICFIRRGAIPDEYFF